MITLNVNTPVGRVIYTNGHRGKSFFVAPCKINVFAGAVLLETIDAAGQVDFRAELVAKEGHSPVDVDLQKVVAKAVPAPKPTPKPAPKTAPKPAPKPAAKKPGRSGGAR